MSINVITLLAVTVGLAQRPAQLPSGDEVLQLAIKQRRDITKVMATFRSVLEERETKESSKKRKKAPPELRIKFWLDGTKLRNDRLPGSPAIECLNCPREGEFIRSLGGKPDTLQPTVTVYLGKISQGGAAPLTDPRILGLQPVYRGIMYSYRIDTIMGRADRTKPALEKGKWQGHDCYVVRLELTGPKTKFAFTIIPAMDHSVVRVEAENRRPDNTVWSATCESAMQRYGKPGWWFPKSCITESKVDGKLEWRDTVEVSDVTLNEPLPAKVFSLSGMDIPVGAIVMDTSSPGKLFEWDGKSVVELPQPPSKKTGTSETPSQAQQRRNPPRTMLFAASGSLGVLAMVALGLFYRKRKPGAPA